MIASVAPAGRETGATQLETALAGRIAEVAIATGLSPREREVLNLLVLGRNHREIAMALGITPRTARFHQSNVLEKIGAESRLDVMRVLLVTAASRPEVA